MMASDNALILALDLGTTSNRAILFDRQASLVAVAQREFRQHYPSPGWVEHDPMEILASMKDAMLEVLDQAADRPVHAIGLANQRESVVVWDRRTGEPLMPAIVWQDRRTADLCKQLAGRAEMIRARTGLMLDPYFSASKMLWIMENKPQIAARLLSGDAVFGTVDSWAIWHLTGGKVFATEASNASRTMLFDLQKLRFSEELTDLFQVPRSALAEVLASDGSFGTTDPEFCAGWEIPIRGVLGDQQAALFAHGGWREGVVKNTYGTGLFLLTVVGSEPVVTEKMLCTVAWAQDSGAAYALEGSVFIGGAAVQWLRDELGLIQSVGEIEALARELEDNEGVYFVPALTGLGAPYWAPEARGVLCGLTRGTGPRHFARAALEAIAYQSRDVIEAMSGTGGLRLERLLVDGGASANDFLMQFQADLLGVPLERPAVLETTALGAAAMAGIASGFWADSEEFLQHRKVERVFEPRMAAEQRTRLYAGWKEAVRRCLPF